GRTPLLGDVGPIPVRLDQLRVAKGGAARALRARWPGAFLRPPAGEARVGAPQPRPRHETASLKGKGRDDLPGAGPLGRIYSGFRISRKWKYRQSSVATRLEEVAGDPRLRHGTRPGFLRDVESGTVRRTSRRRSTSSSEAKPAVASPAVAWAPSI